VERRCMPHWTTTNFDFVCWNGAGALGKGRSHIPSGAEQGTSRRQW
jgi:hypothetical protein